MIISKKCKQHIDSCRFCWMCHHICPIGNATGHERSTARARALGISLVNRGAIELKEIMDNIYECCTCGACNHDCTTGWDPVMFTKEVRLQAALENELPDYINKLVDNCLNCGNAYAKSDISKNLSEKIKNHSNKTDTLLLLGVDARFILPNQAQKAIKVLENAGVLFTVLEDEKPTGWQLDFLIGATEETKQQMSECAKTLDEFKTIVVYDPNDSKTIKQTFGEYGVKTKAKVVTYTTFLADLVDNGKLKSKNKDKTVVFQDPYQLSRDLEETDESRKVISSFATLHEMLLNKGETVWAGNILMSQYLPEVIKEVSKRRLYNVKSIGEKTVVTASVSEYFALKQVKQNEIEILSIEDLILGKEAD